MSCSSAWLCEFCLLGKFGLRLELLFSLENSILGIVTTDKKGSMACKVEFLSWKRSVFKYLTEDWFWSVAIFIFIQLLYYGRRCCGSNRVHDICMCTVIFSFAVCTFLSFIGLIAFISRYLLKSQPFFSETICTQAAFVSAVRIVGSGTHICSSNSFCRKSR